VAVGLLLWGEMLQAIAAVLAVQEHQARYQVRL
jgi:hypothetical protein